MNEIKMNFFKKKKKNLDEQDIIFYNKLSSIAVGKCNCFSTTGMEHELHRTSQPPTQLENEKKKNCNHFVITLLLN